MKMWVLLSLFFGLSFANCIFDTNLQRPICIYSDGNRLNWEEYVSMPIDAKFAIQNEILISIARGEYKVKDLTQTEAQKILDMRNISYSIVKVTTPIKKCASIDSSWAQYCYMMNNGNDLIDCDHVDAILKKEIVERMWDAQGCVR